MRELKNEGNGLHKGERNCNPTIIDLRDRARLTNDARAMMNSMYDKREANEIRTDKDDRRIQERAKVLKQEIGREDDER